MKTTLCLTCWYGLVREYDCDLESCKERHFLNKCLLGNDRVGIIAMCTRYKKKETKTTYHDPDFKEYVDKIQTEAVKEAPEETKEWKDGFLLGEGVEGKNPMEYDGEAGCWREVK